MSETLPPKQDTSLMTDETSKFASKYGVFIVSDKDQNSYLLGLREMAESARTTLDTFKEILNNINAVCRQCEKDRQQPSVGYQILTHIRDTVSD